ncbi:MULTISPECIES: hypothetical protein [Aerosakkonema]|uniref:hypothetical protein n=1 Tax=Aerosakkonema TaxID=1246629 RepID=UPI0035BA2FB6
MKKPVWTILLLALLVMAIVSPFSALALLMFFVLISAIVSTIWTLLRTALSEDV